MVHKLVKHQTHTHTRVHTRLRTHTLHMAPLLQTIVCTSSPAHLQQHWGACTTFALRLVPLRPVEGDLSPISSSPSRTTPPAGLVLDLNGGHRQLGQGFLDPQGREAGGRVGVPALPHQFPHHTQSLAESRQGETDANQLA